MAVTDILDDLGGPSIQEVLVAETPPSGRALSTLTADDLTKLSALHFAPITARRCEVEREQAKVLLRIKEAAAMASNEFYYSFPVKKKGGGTDYIEGISIDGAMACLQAYGNAEIDCRPIDIGHSWIFLARFIDHERGTSVIRPFLQRKVGGSRLGGEDEGRRLEIAFNIGASKATRNVIANAIRPYTNFCFDEAKNDLVRRVGAKLPEAKARALERLKEINVDLKRVEQQLGRVAAEWTAREVAGLITQIRAIQQGLATPNDIWPAPVPAEPRRSDEVAPATANVTATAGPVPPEGKAEPQTAGTGAKIPPQPGSGQPEGSEPASEVERNWRLPPDMLGQDAILKALYELLEMTRTQADVDALTSQNGERIAKITGTKGSQWRFDVQTWRTAITQGKVS
jgi:hypothetical protein